MSKETYLNGKKVKRIYLGPRVVKKLFLGTNMVYTIVPTVDINQMKGGVQSGDWGKFKWRKNNDAWSGAIGDEWFPESENRLILDDTIQIKDIAPASGLKLVNVTNNGSVVTNNGGIYSIPLKSMNVTININYANAGPATIYFEWKYKDSPAFYNAIFDEFLRYPIRYVDIAINDQTSSPITLDQGSIAHIQVSINDTSLTLGNVTLDDGRVIGGRPINWEVDKTPATITVNITDASGYSKIYSPYETGSAKYFFAQKNTYVATTPSSSDPNKPFNGMAPYNTLLKQGAYVFPKVYAAIFGPPDNTGQIAANSCIAKIPSGFRPKRDVQILDGLRTLHFTDDGYGSSSWDSIRNVPVIIRANGDIICGETINIHRTQAKGGNRDYVELQFRLGANARWEI